MFSDWVNSEMGMGLDGFLQSTGRQQGRERGPFCVVDPPICLWPGARPGASPQRGDPRLQLPRVVLLCGGHSVRRVSDWAGVRSPMGWWWAERTDRIIISLAGSLPLRSIPYLPPPPGLLGPPFPRPGGALWYSNVFFGGEERGGSELSSSSHSEYCHKIKAESKFKDISERECPMHIDSLIEMCLLPL